MDYEKKYKEALERFKAFKEKYYTKNTVIGDAIFDKTGEMQKDFESIFHELRESEEETTRKELLDFVRSFWADHKEKLPQASRWVDYLEKQKEQKPVEWSEEDESCWNLIWDILDGPFSASKKSFKKAAAWFLKNCPKGTKSLRPSWKPSDQDELMKLKYAGTSTKLD